MKIQIKLIIFNILVLSANCNLIFAQNSYSPKTAFELATECSKKDSLDSSVEFLKNNIEKLSLPAEKRASYTFLASIQEQQGYYEDAMKNYAVAASIAASDAKNMPEKSSEQLVLDAVRCALNFGDWKTAQTYLNSKVRSSQNPKITGFVKLYEQWSFLCKAQNFEEISENIILLKTYSTLDSMAFLRPQILFTLWQITGENEYSQALQKEFPLSAECAVVKGEVQLLPGPFWFFVPKNNSASNENKNLAAKEKNSLIKTNISESLEISEENQNQTLKNSAVKLQLGLFKEKSNAESLIKTLKEKGFDSYIEVEKKPSGNVYFIVIVDENENKTQAQKLKSLGFESYPVF